MEGFNLWTEPWIVVVRPNGELQEVGIREALMQAHELIALHETSPPLVAGIHRLLTAVIQDAYRPSSLEDVAEVLADEQFDTGLLGEFEAAYAQRFDLFSADAPFLQTADVPLTPRTEDTPVSVGYLLPDEPTGTNITHFRHQYQSDHHFCAPCAARAVVALPAFATAGGRGFRPSINGVPPLYVLPAGHTLFESLALSLVAPGYVPKIAAEQADDQPWWAREPLIPPGHEVQHVGYVESLTFPARRVRLYPEAILAPSTNTCTRCGRELKHSVSLMHFRMGVSRPRDAEPWLDPFAAYRMGKDKPVPVRPAQGKALWREYATLFVTQHERDAGFLPPAIVQQIGDLAGANNMLLNGEAFLAFRCVGIRTDMKAKVFEWTDETLEHVPAGLLTSPDAQHRLRAALDAAEQAARVLDGVFSKWLGAPSPGKPTAHGRTRNADQRQRMRDTYWLTLAGPFRDLVIALPNDKVRDGAYNTWLRTLEGEGVAALTQAAEAMGDDALTLRRQVEAVASGRRGLAGLLKKFGYVRQSDREGSPG